ncbi:hypothetical protein [Acinetobacter bereziniae]|uniref:hypothetical protein n=1 Tax=Acinetobacter bereziniae TaxID=106648 RepID=UPI0018DDEC2B|nr:hypothetical protein [Acinetobacter bereziniae]MBI0394488.1 hypothetical protein [Acinetobacter bereziniae]
MSLDNLKKYAEFDKITEGKKVNIELPSDFLSFVNAVGSDSLILDWSAENITLYGIYDIYNMQDVYSNDMSLYVLGDIIANPIFYSSTTDYKVKIAKHGVGKIELEPLAKNFEEFIAILDCYVQLFYITYNKKILNDDYEVLNDFKDNLIEELLNITDENCINTFIKFL